MTATAELVGRLRGLLEKAAPGNLATAERHVECETVECPACNGEGEIDAADYCNFDGVAIGVQFYGIGHEFGAHEALWRETIAALPTLLTTIENLAAALEPFAEFARQNTSHDGSSPVWDGLRCERERINVWFGPTDFYQAAQSLSRDGGGDGAN